VRFDYINAQEQRKLTWPATFVLARAYLDQLGAFRRPGGREHLGRPRGSHAARSGCPRTADGGLARIGARLATEARSARDRAKVDLLRGVVGDLAAM